MHRCPSKASLAAVDGKLGQDDASGWLATTATMRAIAGSHDTEEGVRAFFEGRTPKWLGR